MVILMERVTNILCIVCKDGSTPWVVGIWYVRNSITDYRVRYNANPAPNEVVASFIHSHLH